MIYMISLYEAKDQISFMETVNSELTILKLLTQKLMESNAWCPCSGLSKSSLNQHLEAFSTNFHWQEITLVKTKYNKKSFFSQDSVIEFKMKNWAHNRLLSA